MEQLNSAEYYAAREQREMGLASAALDPDIALIHLEMANRYSALVSKTITPNLGHSVPDQKQYPADKPPWESRTGMLQSQTTTFDLAVLPETGSSPVQSETDRLTALADYRVLDTEAEPGFDDAILIAAQLCDVPIALVSLVDEHRQWFKAAVGLAVTETPRSISFCDHAIRDLGVFVVEDATLDPRFADNPLVTGEPHVRFYAGAPLITAEGFAIGTVCVLDHRPRTLTDGQRVALAALARQVMAQLELRWMLARQREGEEHRRLLTSELEHRIKNTLSVVQAIVSQSLRTATTPADARDAIAARLVTLGHAHDLLTQASWTAAPIAALVKGAVGDYGEDGTRIRLSGPNIHLNARAALAISMALHELTTNAAKYGALSTEAGHVDIDWSCQEDMTPTVLQFVWQEHGGPPVSVPERKGFGTRLIETSLTRDLGRGRIEYLPAGVRWSVSANLANVQELSATR